MFRNFIVAKKPKNLMVYLRYELLTRAQTIILVDSFQQRTYMNSISSKVTPKNLLSVFESSLGDLLIPRLALQDSNHRVLCQLETPQRIESKHNEWNERTSCIR
jgi:hypothetical protein